MCGEVLVACKVLALDAFAFPEADYGIHAAADDSTRRGVSAGTDPLLMSVFFAEQLAHVFAIVPEYRRGYKLYSRRPWSALPVTKVVLPTASEKMGWPWGG